MEDYVRTKTLHSHRRSAGSNRSSRSRTFRTTAEHSGLRLIPSQDRAAAERCPGECYLLLSEDVERAIAPLSDVTHIVFAAYLEKDTPGERSEVNVALLRNLLTAVERNAPGLKHVTLYQGGKAYGADLGPFKTPAREDDPRLMEPNFYYDQEDFLRERQAGKQWSYSVLRPEAVCGYAVGNPNLTMVIAIYASISKELGVPLRFPGPEAAYRALHQVTSATILVKQQHPRVRGYLGRREEVLVLAVLVAPQGFIGVANKWLIKVFHIDTRKNTLR